MRKNFLIFTLIFFTWLTGFAQQNPVIKTLKVEATPKSLIPETILGNWLKTDGSNEWVYGFYENMAICDNEFWNEPVILSKGKNYQIQLQKDGKIKTLFIKLTKNGNIFIGIEPNKMELMSRIKTFNKKYIIKDNDEFSQPIFKQDTAIYKGFINKYNSKFGKTGVAAVDNILTNEQNPYIININSNGTFEFKCPLLHPQRIIVKLPNMCEFVYLEPGKTTVQCIDTTENISRYKSKEEYFKRGNKTLFMGENARVNADLLSVDSIRYFDYDKVVQSEILNMSADQYKTYCLDVMKKEQKTLQEYLEINKMCKKALTILQLNFRYRTYDNILSYNMLKESAKGKQITKRCKDGNVNPEYYNFIQAVELNNPISLVSSYYTSLINHLNITESNQGDTLNQSPNFQFVAFSDSVKTKNIKLLSNEQELLNKLIECKTIVCMKATLQQDPTTTITFFEKYNSILQSIGNTALDKVTNENLQKYFGLTDGLAKEVMFSQRINGIMKGSNKSFSVEEKQRIREKIKTTFISDYLIQCSKVKEDKIERTINVNKTNTGYNINETTKTEGDNVFDAIVQKYKGKVLFVDFWATWCGPCRAGIQKMKPIKEELKDKDVVFIYLTDDTSPVDTWNLMIPNIKGEHYRLTADEWSCLKSRFQFSAIPHYTLVNKVGEVVKNGFSLIEGNECKNLIEKYLK
jgi:thiol-disulfide isomerase/thioredoxin